MATCAYCGQPILWTTTPYGRRMPVDPRPVQFGGNVALLDPGSPVPLSRVVGKAEEYDGPRWKAHFTSCPRGGKKARRKRAA